MPRFRVYLDGKLIANGYQCSGRYDVANDLFPEKDGFARVAVIDRTDKKYEFVLLSYDNARLVVEAIP